MEGVEEKKGGQFTLAGRTSRSGLGYNCNVLGSLAAIIPLRPFFSSRLVDIRLPPPLASNAREISPSYELSWSAR